MKLELNFVSIEEDLNFIYKNLEFDYICPHLPLVNISSIDKK
jgi:hypothetical protein